MQASSRVCVKSLKPSQPNHRLPPGLSFEMLSQPRSLCKAKVQFHKACKLRHESDQHLAQLTLTIHSNLPSLLCFYFLFKINVFIWSQLSQNSHWFNMGYKRTTDSWIKPGI